jgi:hypothetical protein
MTNNANVRGSVLLRVAVVLLCLAVFCWGLHYKMSLYRTGSSPLQQASPAKLWTGDRSSSGLQDAVWSAAPRFHAVEGSHPAGFVLVFILLPFMANGRVFWPDADLCPAGNRQRLSSHSAFFFFRPPPSNL